MGNLPIPKEIIITIIMNDYRLIRTCIVLCKTSQKMLYQWLDDNVLCLGVIHSSLNWIRSCAYDDILYSVLNYSGSDDIDGVDINNIHIDGEVTVKSFAGPKSTRIHIYCGDKLIYDQHVDSDVYIYDDNGYRLISHYSVIDYHKDLLKIQRLIKETNLIDTVMDLRGSCFEDACYCQEQEDQIIQAYCTCYYTEIAYTLCVKSINYN